MRSFTLTIFFVSLLFPIFQVFALKGDSQCGYLVCINATVENDIVTYQMTARKERMGWLALGFGHRMAGSDMIVMWRNQDGSLTISHRHAKDHTEPEVDETPLRTAFLPPHQTEVWDSKLKPENTLSFNLPIDRSQWIYDPKFNASLEHLIWAYGMGQPAESDPHTSIYGHYAAGSLQLNLDKDLHEINAVDLPVDTIIPPDTQKGSRPPYSTHELIVLGHGFLMTIGMLVLLPAGALVARWTRTFSGRWFKAHKILNFMIALPVILVGWSLGPFAVFDAQAAHFMDTHQIFGIVVLGLYLLQVYLGRYIHARRGLPNRAPHAPSNILHVCLGVIVVGAGFLQVRSGMYEWQEHTGRPGVSHWCHYLWRTWIIALPVFYFSGLTLLKRQFYQESHGLNPSSVPQHYVALSPDEGDRSMLFTADTDDQMVDSYEYANHSTTALSKEAETAGPLLQRNLK